MAFKKRIIKAYAAIRSYRSRLKRFFNDDDPPSPPPSVQSVFTYEFTSEFEERPDMLAREFSGEFTSEFS